MTRGGKLVPLHRISGDTGDLSDEALVAACATGDPGAFGALFDRFNVAVYRFAGRLLRGDQAARDDLVQATFLEIRRAARSFRGTSSVKTWILGVAAHVAQNQLRGERRRRAHLAAYAEQVRVVPDAVDQQVERKRVLDEIAHAIATLPRDQQDAFVLCDVEQLPGTEVAHALDIAEGTLWRRLHYARKAIRAAVERVQR